MKFKSHIITIVKILTFCALVIHLYGIHAKLLFHLNPDMPAQMESSAFTFTSWDEYTLIAKMFSMAYALATAGLLFIYTEVRGRFAIVPVFALLDAFGVYVYYNTNIVKDFFVNFASIYYAIYTFSIIMSLGYHRLQVLNLDNQDALILRMYNFRMSMKKIADILKISKSSVRRVIKKSP